MRIVYMGSGTLACPPLEHLLRSEEDEVVAVVTQPDRPKGRHLKIGSCPANELAERAGVPILTPEKVGRPESIDLIAGLKPDLIAVAAYGQYISPKILDLPPHGAINVHPSLLPKYRGAAPIRMAIADGERVTGVTILYVAKEMDAGDIILQEEMPIGEDDTTETMTPRLAELGAVLLLRAIEEIRSGSATRTPQDEAQATYVPKLKKEDGRIDWSNSAAGIRNRIRAFHPWPGSFCEAPLGSGRMLKIIRAQVEDASGEAGTVLDVKGEAPLVAASDGALRLLDVQPEGKKAMTGRAYLCGYGLKVGDKLG